MSKTIRTAGSNVLFAAVAEMSDSVLKGAEASGFNGMVNGFHQGILKLAMDPSLLGTAILEGGPDRKITLDRSPRVDESYIKGYLQAMLDTTYKRGNIRVCVTENQVLLRNLPPNGTLIDEIMDRVKSFLVRKALLKGEPSTTSHPLHHLPGESEWKIGPAVLTLCEHLFVSFAIRMLRKQANKLVASINQKIKSEGAKGKEIIPVSKKEQKRSKFDWKGGICSFVFTGMIAYVDGRLCRHIPNAIARRIVSGFLLNFPDKNDKN